MFDCYPGNLVATIHIIPNLDVFTDFSHQFNGWSLTFALAHVCTAVTAVGAAFATFFSDETTAEGCETVGEQVWSAIVYSTIKEVV